MKMTIEQFKRLNELEQKPGDEMTEAEFDEMEALADIALESMDHDENEE